MNEKTGTGIITDEERREALRRKIAAAEERNAQRSLSDTARDAADTALDYVREHPLRSIVMVAAGALVIGAFTRRGRHLGQRSGQLAALATDAALAYGMRVIDSATDAAESGQNKLAELGGAVGSKARKLKHQAANDATEAGNKLRSAAKKTGKSAQRSIKDLRSRLAH